MKNRIGISIMARIGILISCCFAVGCSYLAGYITIDSQSKVMKPTFCVYLDRCFRHHQERLDIETITVSKVQRSSEEKEGWNFGSPARWGSEDEQRVWYLEYKSSDNFIFSTMPVSLAQQQVTAQAQAKADAHRDVNRDMRESLWFLAGLVGSSAGAFTGCASGILAGYLMGDFLPDDIPTIEGCGIGGVLLFGILAAPICVHLYPHSPSPPLERLLGKSPEYMEAYTQAYKSRTVLLRKIFVTAGSIVSNLGVMTLLTTQVGLGI